MELYDLMMNRRSVRNFEDKDIPNELIEKLLDSAINAPTGGNIQPISIIVVKDEDNRKELSEMTGRQPWVRNAPLSMIFCIDFLRIKRWAEMFDVEFQSENALLSFLIAYADLMCSAQNVVILAENSGLGSVYIGTILSFIDRCREHFHIPKYVLPMMVLSLGYPRSKPKHIPKLSRDILTHNEKYESSSDNEIRAAFEEKYGDFNEHIEKYLKKVFVEAIEANETSDWANIDKIKEEMKRLEIRNNAQFLFKFRYPSEKMVEYNRYLFESFQNAGFSFFRTDDCDLLED